MTFLSRFVVIFALLIMTMTSYANSQPNNLYRNFWLPTYHGCRLNYCTLDAKSCGLSVATRYCQMMGYQRADQQLIDYNVGLTNIIDSRATCKGQPCNSFKTIRCVANLRHKPPAPYHYRYQKFVYPRFEGCRVDWCYGGKNGCGQRAAFSFCRRMGYLNARSYKIEKSVTATKAIGNQKLCFGKQCDAFKWIICAR